MTHVATLHEFDNSLREACGKRTGDGWVAQILERISGVSDLHAADAFYHKKCCQHFHLGKSIPAQFTSIPNTEGKKLLVLPLRIYLIIMSFILYITIKAISRSKIEHQEQS